VNGFVPPGLHRSCHLLSRWLEAQRLAGLMKPRNSFCTPGIRPQMMVTTIRGTMTSVRCHVLQPSVSGMTM
jgi:hypothetical protein